MIFPVDVKHANPAKMWRRLCLGGVAGIAMLAAAGCATAGPVRVSASPSHQASQQTSGPCPYEGGTFCTGPSGSWSS